MQTGLLFISSTDENDDAMRGLREDIKNEVKTCTIQKYDIKVFFCFLYNNKY